MKQSKIIFFFALTLLFSNQLYSQVINIRGKGVTIADNDASPSTTDDTNFGRQLASSGSITKVYTIENTGTSTLVLGAISIGGTNAAEFTYTSPSTNIAPGSSTTFTITFNPATGETGNRIATFSISSNDAVRSPYNFALQGTAFANNTVRWVNNQGASTPANVVVDGITYTTLVAYTDIPSAITAATTDDIVYISNGVYRNTAETTSIDCDFFGQLQDPSLYIQINKTITITSATGNYCSSSARLVGYSFNIHTASNITIQGLTMDSVRLNGFWNSNCCAFPPSANVKIKNNKILNTRGHGIKTDSPGDGTTQIDRGAWEITGNFFLNIGFYNGYGRCTSPMSVSAVWLADASTNFDISNNVIVNTKWAGILCDGYGGKGAQEGIVTIRGNRVHNTIDAGIQIGMNSSPGVFYYPTNAVIANNTITNANTSNKVGIGGITILQSVCRGITINNNDVSNSFNGLTICIAGWQNSSGAIRMINYNNFYNLSGGFGLKHIANVAPNCLCGNADDLANYDFKFNYWGSNNGPTYSTNPGGTGVSLYKESSTYSTNDFDFSAFATAANTVTSVAIPCDGAADYFRSKNSSSTWSDIGDWESSYNNVTFKNASQVPTNGATNVLIQSGHNVVLGSADASVGDLTLLGSINLNGRLLSLKGNITGTGTINATNGTAEFRASAAQTIPASLFTSNTVKDLTIHNTAVVGAITTLTGALNVTGTLTPSLGSFVTGGFLTLKSNASGTARVASSTGTVSGNITQELYIPAKASRKWSLVSSPFLQTLSNGWQQQVHITGTNTGTTACTTDATTGFDVTSTNAPSLYTYNAANTTGNRWVVVTNTNAMSTDAGKGFRMLIRGPRTGGCALLNGTSLVPSAVTLSTTGALNNTMKNSGSFNVNYTNTGVSNYVLVGNPYPSQISFSAFRSTNSTKIANSYAIYNPQSNAGVYTYWNGSSFTGGAGGTNATGDVIASGAAFFVSSIGAGNFDLAFDESHKTSSTSNAYMRNSANSKEIRIHYKDANLNQLDEILLIVGDLSEKNNDIPSINSGSHFITSYKAKVPMAVQYREELSANDTVLLNVAATVGNYNLSFSNYSSLMQTTTVYFRDKVNNVVANVKDLSKGYTYAVTNDNINMNANRFELIFARGLPVSLTYSNIKIYPNPAANSINLIIPSFNNFYTVSVKDLSGKIIMTQKSTNSNPRLNIKNLSSGAYIIEVKDAKGVIGYNKFIKQ